VQASPEASPLKWHLGHTTWFWAMFVLADNLPKDYNYLFNSYYNSVGERTNRAKRGIQSRPGLQEVLAWREDVD